MSGELAVIGGRVVVEVEQADGTDAVREVGGTAEAEALLRGEGVDEQGLRYLGEEVASFGEAMLTLMDGTWIRVARA